MIITPHELQQWMDEKRIFQSIDLRSSNQRREFPLTAIKPLVADTESLPVPNGEPVVLICQFGIVTEGIIIEKELEKAYSLLGGALAWEALQSEKQDLSRWSRQTVLPEIGATGQGKLNRACIAIVGIGGLGCPAATMLAAAGIGTLKLIDGDRIELSNIHRQPLYGIGDVGKMKVTAATAILNNHYDQVSVVPVVKSLDERNALDYLQGVDVIIDATDNIKARQVIDRASRELKIPMVYGGLYRFEGQVAILNHDGSPGFNELFPHPPYGGDTCSDAGVLGMLPGIIGNMQALEAVKLIVDMDTTLSGKLLIYDGLTHETTIIKLYEKK